MARIPTSLGRGSSASKDGALIGTVMVYELRGKKKKVNAKGLYRIFGWAEELKIGP